MRCVQGCRDGSVGDAEYGRDLVVVEVGVMTKKRVVLALRQSGNRFRISGHSGESWALARSNMAELRQLTVMFCDLVDSTPLSSRLDPEELREVVRAYQETCARVIALYGGHIAYYLGDGLLVYFGYPRAHEDDAQRAVRAGLGIIEAMGRLNNRLTGERGVSLAVRVGCIPARW